MEEVIEYLVSDELGYKVCFHDRDFEVGYKILDNISTAMKHSRKMIAVITRYKKIQMSKIFHNCQSIVLFKIWSQ